MWWNTVIAMISSQQTSITLYMAHLVQLLYSVVHVPGGWLPLKVFVHEREEVVSGHLDLA